jgi:hypothetical protein
MNKSGATDEGGDRKSEAFQQQKNQGSGPTLIGRGSAYVRARLERDGRTELLVRY